ncbi:MAG: hypothetical protein KF699_06220 [Phycisphaeraceae bacterium]|nr:hypothetical protein [Phycisphaeraceae bacterium]
MMTTSDFGRARPARRRGGLAAAAASIAGSALVHGAFAMVAAGVAWHVVGATRDPGRDVVIHFEDPGLALGEDPDAAPAATRAEVVHTKAEEAQPSRERALSGAEPAERDAASPADLPPSVLTAGRATSTVAVHREARSEATILSDGDTLTGGGVRFAGLGASNARSVVYVVDASGPMVTSLPRVLQEVVRSAEQLSPVQKFGVVLFREAEDGAGLELFSPVLVRATPTAKRRLAEWLSAVEPRGASNPLAGLEVALDLKPDAVFLLSRSIARSGGGVWNHGLEATLARLDELNPPLRGERGPVRRPVLIQTIQFLDDDPTGIMQAIGARHGQGAGYRVVRRSEDLGRKSR